MKEVGIKWDDMNQTQQNSIIILKGWLHQMWSKDDIKDYYSLHKWISEIPDKNTLISASDLAVLKELWDVYSSTTDK